MSEKCRTFATRILTCRIMSYLFREEVELLAPARTADIGIAAINCGADAVYIGAERFGARAAAGNSVHDIARLTAYAHRFRAKVFVTVNTLLTDDELEQAEALIWQLHEAGVDAIIVQDTRITTLNLPPIELHASTQCDIRTLDRVKELEAMGFRQVVLARELSIDEISNIANNTSCVVETFIHGALCVSYSGRCFMSEKVCGRSANRGECAQMCRLPYDLIDGEGNVLLKNKYLLSLKDFNASDHLEELISAGVRSFKIEGRLKDEAYVKNVVGYYRQRIDAIVNSQLKKASLGQISLGFEPDITRTFYRGGTDYFLSGERNGGLCTMVTGKALGKKITPDTKLNNGDGVCWIDPESGELKGSLIDGTQHLPKDVDLYRNNDIEFERILKSARPERRIPISINVSEISEGFRIAVPEFDIALEVACPYEQGRNAEMALATWQTELTKLGNTEFVCNDLSTDFSSPWFVPRSRFSDWRRQLVDRLREKITEKTDTKPTANNCQNQCKSKPIELAHIGEAQPDLFQLSIVNYQFNGELMRCRYCIRAELGTCLKHKTKPVDLYLRNSAGRRFRLVFDCERCEMIIKDPPH